MQIMFNKSKRTKQAKYIVIHDTGNTNKGADAQSHFNYFNSANRGSSADFFVDDKEALQVNDYKKYYTWHCGDGRGQFGITNENSIGVEICVNSDGNYEIAFNNAVRLVKQLMTELNIPLENVVRHYDASRKICPKSMSSNNWELWETFKLKVRGDDMDKLIELEKRISGLENKMIYNYVDDNMPDWAKPTIKKLMDKGYLKGNEKGELGLTDDLLKILVINDRAGLY